jgi:6-pyruvoyltetrahydropterin/6-carboxytetrahydropterin synthase
MVITIQRVHDFSYGHRVFGHEGSCSRLHGHNGRVIFTVAGDELDSLGRVLDFSLLNQRLCQWIEMNWDHRFLVWEEDPWVVPLRAIDISIEKVPFNPTAENMAKYLVEVVGPMQLSDFDVKLVSCEFWETVKCSATVTKR